MAAIKPFQISVPQKQIDVLQEKLSLATLPDELNGAEWDLGSPLADVSRLVQHWKTGFDWRAQEASLNALPQFTTTVEVPGFESLVVHFIHQKSNVTGAIPLLFIHGWPGSFIEVTKILPLLRGKDGQSPIFDIVAPSLPSFGFSEGATRTGFGLKQYAQSLNELMATLGYKEYVTQGGDWGSIISRTLSQLFPQNVKATHLNFFPSYPPWPWKHPMIFLQSLGLIFNSRDKAGLRRAKWFNEQGQGYAKIQASKPQTIGYALQDSPVALLAWIYEKLHDWTDEYPWTDDEILTWVSIYWFSKAGPAASVRIYYESLAEHTPAGGVGIETAMFSFVPKVVLGLSYFPKEIIPMPHAWGRTLGPVVFESHHEKGGHFAAWENPSALALDLCKMFGKKGAAFGIVTGRTGCKDS